MALRYCDNLMCTEPDPGVDRIMDYVVNDGLVLCKACHLNQLEGEE